MPSDDIEQLVEDDIDKFQDVSFGGDMDWGPAAIAEIVFLCLTAATAMGWLVALFWTPDPISGSAWMGAGVFGMLLFGGPAVLLYWLRRGGVEKLFWAIERATR